MPIEEGDKVLDLCAAPGGKSTQLAAKLGQSGVLVSNDISASRARALLKNLENWGARNIIVTSEDAPKLASKWANYFDKILIDAPCSGEGMFRKSEDAVKSWETHGVEHCCNLQRNILENVVTMLKPNGMILYSTCTFSPEEDECMIEAFLDQNPDFSVVPLEGVGGISNGEPQWVPGGGREELRGALRLWPHRMAGEGHFVCLLQRHGEGSGSVPVPKKRKCIKDYKEAAEFISEQTHIDLNTPVEEIKGKLYILPEEAPDLTGIRAIRSGLYLGETKSKRFEPSQALVLAYPKEMFKRTIEIGEDEEMVKRYLKGETLLIEASKGWHIVCMQGYPLGWVKAQNNMLKNQYPASWRMMG
ncbi:RsmF rRNA methyltransferase first C-terminal domain-containing protein [Cellulosilyticum ruminicola]|uniref:RsmF rRNA methyltransferase first C-terminal domain-containing protein n=1 Tax=Cellulosilyticum ruminicola TaxID=425254 RepID=UPI000A51C03A|nr:RsmB/NOP family class I SAM-dependent RNA methyltransferase [Cellulosilyticum ruminicola]